MIYNMAINKVKDNIYNVQEIPLDLLEDNPYQKRKKYGDIEGLAASIKERGLQNPISVVKSDSRYIIVHGHRRTHAFRYLKQKTISAIIRRESSPQDLMLDLAIENIQRKDLLPVEKSATLEQLFYNIPSVKNINDIIRIINQVKIKYGMTRKLTKDKFPEEDFDKAKNILDIMGISYSSAFMSVKLLQLPQHIQEIIVSGDNSIIPEGMIGVKAGYELTRLKDPEKQQQLLEKILKEKMSRSKINMMINRIIEDEKNSVEPKRTDSPLEINNGNYQNDDKIKIDDNNTSTDNTELSKLMDELYHFNLKIENIRLTKFPIIAEYKGNKNKLYFMKKAELDASLDKLKMSCLEMIYDIDKIFNDDTKNDVVRCVQDSNLVVEVSENFRWRLPSKIVNLLGLKKGDVLLLKIDGIKRLSERLIITTPELS